MRFVNESCPECGKHISGMTAATRVYRGLMRAEAGEYDYDGRYLELPETEGLDLLKNGNVLVECEEGHQWETPLMHDVRAG